MTLKISLYQYNEGAKVSNMGSYYLRQVSAHVTDQIVKFKLMYLRIRLIFTGAKVSSHQRKNVNNIDATEKSYSMYEI